MVQEGPEDRRHPAWAAATTDHDEVIPLWVIDPRLWRPSAGKRHAQIHAHLAALDDEFAGLGGRLHVRHGEPGEVVPAVAVRADAVYVNAEYTPYAIRRDDQVADRVPLARFAGVPIHAPEDIMTCSGTPPLVFTPYYRRWREEPWGLWPEPGSARVSDSSGDGLGPVPGEAPMTGGQWAARRRLDRFLERVDRYLETRDSPDPDATSRLSADLHFGTLDARRVRHEVGEGTPARAAFVRQLCWRDFHLQIVYHHPWSVDRELRAEYTRVAWREDREGLAAWQEGRTGYPFVDAGMRQLASEGWMPNRVRMVTASFLVKDLLIDWRHGERWFRKLLVDGDLAQNVGNWQWVAGTGTDAVPYFRVFNPVAQGLRFDPTGEYVRRWVPELAGIRGGDVHTPWQLGPLASAAAGVELGVTYPERMVDHGEARARALAAHEEARAGGSPA